MKVIKWGIPILLLAFSCIFLFNYLTLKHPINKGLKEDYRNNGILIDVHYKDYINYKVLVFNLKNVSGNKAVLDVFRSFLQVSSTLKDKQFEKVELAYKGKTKFFIEGHYFNQLGKEYGYENPMYVTRTFTENLFYPNGRRAYDEWTGGLIAVVSKQMDDFSDFNRKWYLEDMINEQ